MFRALRTGGRAVEGARLESAYTVTNRIVGSNPTLSARPPRLSGSPADAGRDVTRRPILLACAGLLTLSDRAMALVPPQWVCLFDQDSAELLPACQEQLRTLVLTRPVRFWNVIPVAVHGFADTFEAHTPEGRQRLSERRAQVVARFLTLSGIPEHLVRAQGHGALGPEPRARRVEVTTEG